MRTCTGLHCKPSRPVLPCSSPRGRNEAAPARPHLLREAVVCCRCHRDRRPCRSQRRCCSGWWAHRCPHRWCPPTAAPTPCSLRLTVAAERTFDAMYGLRDIVAHYSLAGQSSSALPYNVMSQPATESNPHTQTCTVPARLRANRCTAEPFPCSTQSGGARATPDPINPGYPSPVEKGLRGIDVKPRHAQRRVNNATSLSQDRPQFHDWRAARGQSTSGECPP